VCKVYMPERNSRIFIAWASLFVRRYVGTRRWCMWVCVGDVCGYAEVMYDSLTCGMTQLYSFPILYTLKYSNCTVISFNDIPKVIFASIWGWKCQWSGYILIFISFCSGPWLKVPCLTLTVKKNKLFAQVTYLRALSFPDLRNCSLTETMPS
jgi:hypothetical protein